MDFEELINRPTENLWTELKGWIDLDTPEGQAKIIKTCLAMRNHGGGYLLIGFDDATGQPISENAPPNVRESFHIDKIQSMVAKYASEPFGIELHFPVRDGQAFPVIAIPGGARTPVATKRKLAGAGKKPLVSENKVYVRSLNSNNRPSTTEAIWKDWEAVVEKCFENREADIGNFLRRHLAGLTPEVIGQISEAFSHLAGSMPEDDKALADLLEDGLGRYESIVGERKLELPQHGFWEVGVVAQGEVPDYGPSREFLDMIAASNPSYTGWPMWVDSRVFADEQSRPHVSEGAWESLMVYIGGPFLHIIDFWRIDPRGRFYLRRALQDDVGPEGKTPKPFTLLDFRLVILRTAEAIAVTMAFLKAMGCKPDSTQLLFRFRWSRLKGRILASWSKLDAYLSPYDQAVQDQIASDITVPLDAPQSSLAEYVHSATRPLFQLFDGCTFDLSVTQGLVDGLLNRKL